MTKMGEINKTAKLSDIHTDEATQQGVPILAPGIAGALGAAFYAKEDKVPWLEAQGYVAIDPDSHLCQVTEAGEAWLHAQNDGTMGDYFYRPVQSFDPGDILAQIFGSADDAQGGYPTV